MKLAMPGRPPCIRRRVSRRLQAGWHRRRFRRLLCEPLETRHMLAGDAIGDTLGTARLITVSVDQPLTVADAIATPTDVDMFAFDLAPRQQLTIDVDAQTLGSAVDAIIRAFDASGVELDSNFDFAGSNDPLLRIGSFDGGRYYVGISSQPNTTYDPHVPSQDAGNSTGSYTVKFNLSSVVDDNDTLATADSLALSRGQSDQFVAFIDQPDDVDLYKILLGAGDHLQMIVNSSRLGNVSNLVRVFDDQGHKLADGGINNTDAADSTLDFSALTSGTYFIGISSAPDLDYDPTVTTGRVPGHDTGPYSVAIQLSAIMPDGNDTLATATPLSIDVGIPLEVDHAVDYDRDVDLYSFGLAAGDHFTVNVQATSGVSELDSYLRLFDADGNEVANNSEDSSVLDFAVSATGQYYLGVSGYPNTDYDPHDHSTDRGNVAAPYYLSLKAEPPRPDLVAASIALSTTFGRYGDALTVSYTVKNQGTAPSPAVDVEIRCSADSQITADDSLLAVIHIAALAPDESTSGTADIQLPGVGGQPPAGFPASAVLTLGLRLDPRNVVDETDETNNDNQGLGTDAAQMIVLAPDLELAPLGASVTGQFTIGSVGATRALFLTESGTLTLSVPAPDQTSVAAVAVVRGLDGAYLARTQAASDSLSSQSLTLALPAGGYFVDINAAVDSQPLPATYSFHTDFTPSSLPGNFTSIGQFPKSLLVLDLNHDGYLDIVTGNANSADIAVLLGIGGGAFRRLNPISQPSGVFQLIAADFDRDSNVDLAVIYYGSDDIAILPGNGDGTFEAGHAFPGGDDVESIAAADINQDGIPDLIVSEFGAHQLSLWRGLGDTTFQRQAAVPFDGNLTNLVASDLNDDGLLDLAALDKDNQQLAVFVQQVNGDFSPPLVYSTDEDPGGLIAADFDGDSQNELAFASLIEDRVTVLRLNSDSELEPVTTVDVGFAPTDIAVADFNSDGNLDIATVDSNAGGGSIALGNGDGTFQDAQEFRGDTVFPTRVAAGDVDGDGRQDVILADLPSATGAGSESRIDGIVVLAGRGDGTVQGAQRVVFDTGAGNLISGDFNGDNLPDLVVSGQLGISTALGNGDGTFQPNHDVSLGDAASTTIGQVAAGDFNQDGRLDLVAGISTGQIAIFLGLGDGLFDEPTLIDAGRAADGVVATDLDGDGNLDIAMADSHSNQVVFLFGDGQGGFPSRVLKGVSAHPELLLTADFNGDGQNDLVVASTKLIQGASILINRGERNFDLAPLNPAQNLLGHQFVSALYSADADREGRLDLMLAIEETPGLIAVLHGDGDGRFEPPVELPVGASPEDIATGDFNEDQVPDLITADLEGDEKDFATVLLGAPGGGFAPAQFVHVVPRQPGAFGDSAAAKIVVGDFNADHHFDLAIPEINLDFVRIFLGDGKGNFIDASSGIRAEIRTPPLSVDLDRDGSADLVTLNQSGEILFRRGRGGPDASFDPPRVLNTGAPAHDLAVATDDQGTEIAALDGGGRIRFYRLLAGGSVKHEDGPLINSVPGHIATADLTGDGRADFVVSYPLAGQIGLYIASLMGTFATQLVDFPGSSPTDLTLSDVNGDGRADILASNQASGDMMLLVNMGGGRFATEDRYPATTSLRTVQLLPSGLAAGSADRPVAIATGDFDGDRYPDAAVAEGGANRLLVLHGAAGGGYLQPSIQDQYNTGRGPTAVVAADLDGDGLADIAVLNEASQDVSVFLGAPGGGLSAVAAQLGDSELSRIPVGRNPRGLRIVDINGDQRPDLLVSNDFGDVLTILGNGDGTFRPYQRADGHVALAIADMNGDGTDDFVFANQSLDRVSVQLGTDESVVGDRSAGLLAPTAMQVQDLNADDVPDMIVANSGSNELLVYLGLGDGQFDAAQRFTTGTEPVGMDIADLDGDGILDVAVANRGSNDVSVFLGQGSGDDWTFIPGPRLRAEAGPASVRIADMTGPDGNPDGTPDLLVTNRDANTATILPGVGNGFFNDLNPLVQTVSGAGPVDSLALADGFVTINFQSNDLSFFLGGEETLISSGGTGPIAGITADFNLDGFEDLAVANSGDGAISLFLGSLSGLAFDHSFFNPDLAHPTDLAVSSDGTRLTLYGTGEGRDAAIALFSFDRSIFSFVRIPPAGTQVDFQPLRTSTLGLVATLLSVTALFGADRSRVDEIQTGSSEPLDEAAEQESAPEDADREGMDAAQQRLFRFLMNIDEALKKNNRLLLQRLLKQNADENSADSAHSLKELMEIGILIVWQTTADVISSAGCPPVINDRSAEFGDGGSVEGSTPASRSPPDKCDVVAEASESSYFSRRTRDSDAAELPEIRGESSYLDVTYISFLEFVLPTIQSLMRQLLPSD